MIEADLANAVWRKSSRSSGQGACVEVALLPDVVAVRDSKHPIAPALVVTSANWAGFLNGLRQGHYDTL